MSARIVLITDCDPSPAALVNLRRSLRKQWQAVVDVIPVAPQCAVTAAFWLSRLIHAAVCPRDWHPELCPVLEFLRWTFEPMARAKEKELILLSAISPGSLDDLLHVQLPQRIHVLSTIPAGILATVVPGLEGLRTVVHFPFSDLLADVFPVLRAIQTGELNANKFATPRLGGPVHAQPDAGTFVLDTDDFGYSTLSIRQSQLEAGRGSLVDVAVGGKIAAVPLRAHAGEIGSDRAALFPHGDCDDDPLMDLWVHPRYVLPELRESLRPGGTVTITTAA